MRWPSPKFEFVCKHCGAAEVLIGKNDSLDFAMQGGVRVYVLEPSLDESKWQVVGDDFYCSKHAIEVETKIMIDGQVWDIRRRPWGDRK